MFKMGCSMAKRILAIDGKGSSSSSAGPGGGGGDFASPSSSKKSKDRAGASQAQESGTTKTRASGDELNDFSKLEEDPRIPLNVRQIFKITKSWKAIARTMSKTGTAMFLNLFEQNQDLFYLFDRFQHLKGKELHESMELREHAATVMSTLDHSINSLSDYDNFVTYLHSIGKLHRKVPGFKRDHFWKIEQPFLKAVKQTLDERCNETIEEIYKIAIKLIIETIAEGYGEDQADQAATSGPTGGAESGDPSGKDNASAGGRQNGESDNSRGGSGGGGGGGRAPSVADASGLGPMGAGGPCRNHAAAGASAKAAEATLAALRDLLAQMVAKQRERPSERGGASLINYNQFAAPMAPNETLGGDTRGERNSFAGEKCSPAASEDDNNPISPSLAKCCPLRLHPTTGPGPTPSADKAGDRRTTANNNNNNNNTTNLGGSIYGRDAIGRPADGHGEDGAPPVDERPGQRLANKPIGGARRHSAGQGQHQQPAAANGIGWRHSPGCDHSAGGPSSRESISHQHSRRRRVTQTKQESAGSKRASDCPDLSAERQSSTCLELLASSSGGNNNKQSAASAADCLCAHHGRPADCGGPELGGTFQQQVRASSGRRPTGRAACWSQIKQSSLVRLLGQRRQVNRKRGKSADRRPREADQPAERPGAGQAHADGPGERRLGARNQTRAKFALTSNPEDLCELIKMLMLTIASQGSGGGGHSIRAARSAAVE